MRLGTSVPPSCKSQAFSELLCWAWARKGGVNSDLHAASWHALNSSHSSCPIYKVQGEKEPPLLPEDA